MIANIRRRLQQEKIDSKEYPPASSMAIKTEFAKLARLGQRKGVDYSLLRTVRPPRSFDFESLPCDVIMMILSYITSIEELHKLRDAVPRVAQLVDIKLRAIDSNTKFRYLAELATWIKPSSFWPSSFQPKNMPQPDCGFCTVKVDPSIGKGFCGEAWVIYYHAHKLGTSVVQATSPVNSKMNPAFIYCRQCSVRLIEKFSNWRHTALPWGHTARSGTYGSGMTFVASTTENPVPWKRTTRLQRCYFPICQACQRQLKDQLVCEQCRRYVGANGEPTRQSN